MLEFQPHEPVQINLPSDLYLHGRIAWVNFIFPSKNGMLFAVYDHRRAIPKLFSGSELVSLRKRGVRHVSKM